MALAWLAAAVVAVCAAADADYAVDPRALPGWHDGLPAPPMYAGTLSASPVGDEAGSAGAAADGELFFWLVEPTGTATVGADGSSSSSSSSSGGGGGGGGVGDGSEGVSSSPPPPPPAPAKKQEKLAIWLQGGPGCSSMAGMFVENGPFRITSRAAEQGQGQGQGQGRGKREGAADTADAPPSVEQLRLHWNPHAWSEVIPVMWMEQPVGVGFATPGTTRTAAGGGAGPRLATDESEVAAAFHGWLRRWLATPQFARYAGAEIYFFGESYAGHYVPMIVHHIQRQNGLLQQQQQQQQQQQGEGESGAASAAAAQPPIRVGGMAVGNGWFDPMTQNPAYTEYAFGHGLVDEAGKRSLDARWAACNKSDVAFMLDGCGMQEAVQAASAHVNEYDTDLFGEYTFLQPDCASSTAGTADCAYVALLNDLEVQRALHAVPPGATAARPWTLCSAAANARLLADTPMSVRRRLIARDKKRFLALLLTD